MADITNINDNKMLPDAELDIMRVIWSAEKPLCAREIAMLLGDTRNWKTSFGISYRIDPLLFNILLKYYPKLFYFSS